ncbi:MULTISPECIES: CHAT domain-containing protein [Streptomyces]|uniref:CHAT domain protein n=1 Tax=Streptomyces chartreusis NRRL 3882 TaxID=1079985 RepID=A0A2N9B3X0_STRCX|nr:MULTISPECIES: CHAT domain-containing protein [Streptomyces]MYS88865.1 CHAT domain-containing protein [Streptomyces sp. SID5464]SOR78046.1 CHAT domain protein [Streptomyces chartreusis NRRL 3882]
MTIPYDLQALLYEIDQRTKGIVSGEDLAGLSGLVLDRLGCTTAEHAYDRLYTDWAELPRGTVASGLRAGQVLSVLPLLRLEGPLVDAQREEELWRAMRDHGPADETWRANVVVRHSAWGLRHLTDPAQMEAALARIEQARAAHPPGTRIRANLDMAHAGLRTYLGQLGGGEDDFDTAVDDMARLAQTSDMAPEQRLVMSAQVALFRIHQASRRGDEAALAEQIGVLEHAMAQLPAGHMDRFAFESHLEAARGALTLLRGQRTGRFEPATEGAGAATPTDEIRRRIATLPVNAQADKLTEAGFAVGQRALLTMDHQAMRESMELREAALDLLEPDDDRWIRVAGGLGVSHCVMADLQFAPPADRALHLDQGIAWLRHTLRLTGGPHHPLWGGTGITLAKAYRLRGDEYAHDARTRRLNYDASRRVGLQCLRAAAWSALLQSGTAHAAETARMAGAQALDVARWCLADGAHADAVRALDAGRGLVLHAATAVTTVPEMLKELGRTELAREWQAAGSVPEVGEEMLFTAQAAFAGPSSRLRRRVLEALADSPRHHGLLDVPSPEDIGGALRAMDATALVYLVPGDGAVPGLLAARPGSGAAVLVTADGRTRSLDLPHLTVDAPPLTAYRATGTPGRDAGGPPVSDTSPAPGPAPGPGTSRTALEQLCAWAGTAVMEPLLSRLPRGFGRAPAVVLVPMGELGVVPWHAARLTGRRRSRGYACERADISYTPSARLLCEVAARPAAGTRQTLVVGNPTRDLHHAGEEAEAVHRVFHPDGDLLGPGAATPAAVTDWLRRQRGGLLHLACHGVVRQGERHSAYLALSGGPLAAEELTEGATRYRGLDLVVLAACRTNVSGHGYDEAYSLSTAFLVAGARSVIGSLWPVPDEATSLLMYMTHHFMSRDGLPPGRALRSAQSWMLNDRREAPPGMPAHLRARVGHIDADDLTAWAGFTHLGW